MLCTTRCTRSALRRGSSSEVSSLTSTPPLPRLVYGALPLGSPPSEPGAPPLEGSASVYVPSKVGEYPPEWFSLLALRSVNLAAGAASVALSYLIARLLGISRVSSVLAAACLLLDPMHAILSRLALPDIFALVFLQLAYLAVLAMCRVVERSKGSRLPAKSGATKTRGAAPRYEANADVAASSDTISVSRLQSLRTGVLVLSCIALAAVFSGLALATRWAAYSGALMLLVALSFGIWPLLSRPMRLFDIVFALAIITATYSAVFVTYLALSDRSGSGNAFVSQRFKDGLLDELGGFQNSTASEKVPQEVCTIDTADRSKLECNSAALAALPRNVRDFHWFFDAVAEYNQLIIRYAQEQERGTQFWDSTWYQWIVDWRGVLMAREENNPPPGRGAATQTILYAILNPVMIALVIFFGLVFAAVVCILLRYRSSLHPAVLQSVQPRVAVGIFVASGFWATLLPTLVLYKAGPLTQYVPALFFAQLLFALVIDLLPARSRDVACVLSIVAMAAAYAFLAPWVYYTPLTAAEHQLRRILPKWT